MVLAFGVVPNAPIGKVERRPASASLPWAWLLRGAGQLVATGTKIINTVLPEATKGDVQPGTRRWWMKLRAERREWGWRA